MNDEEKQIVERPQEYRQKKISTFCFGFLVTFALGFKVSFINMFVFIFTVFEREQNNVVKPQTKRLLELKRVV